MSLDPAAILDDLPTIWAAHRGARSVAPSLIVLHTMESTERAGAARSSALWHASGQTIGSAHLHVDGGDGTPGSGEVIRGVPDAERANGAAGANDRGLHLELAGRAGQSAADWADAYSTEVLERGAQIVAAWSIRYGIPIAFVGPADLRSDKAGVTTHAVVATLGLTDHWDPGPAFPLEAFLARAAELAEGADTMPLTANDLADIERVAERAATKAIAKAWADGRPDGIARQATAETVKRQLRTQLKPSVLRAKPTPKQPGLLGRLRAKLDPKA